MYRTSVFIIFILWSVNAFAQYQVSGKVQNVANSNSVEGEVIQLLPTDKIAITGSDGTFIFEDVSPGNYTLTNNSDWWSYAKKIEVENNISDIIIRIQTVEQLKPVIIRSIRFDDDIIPAQTTLNESEVDRLNNARDIPYILQFTPSVVSTSDAGAGVGYTGMRIRGSDQTRINVTLNGIPYNDAESQNVFFVDLPDIAASASSIQIQRGVGTSTNGAASFGASVNINTLDHSEDAGVRVEGLYGSFNTKKASLQFNTGRVGDGFYLSGRMSQITSDGYIDRATSDLRSFVLSPKYIFGKSSIRYDLIYGKERTYQAWYGIDADQLENNRKFNPAGTERPGSPYPDQVDDYTQVHHQLHFNTSLKQNLQLGLSGHYTPGNGFFEEYKADQFRTDYGFDPVVTANDTIDMTDLVRRRWLDNHFYGFVGSLNWNINDKNEFILGGGWNHYIGDHFGEVIWAEFAQGINIEDRYYENQGNKYDGNIYAKLKHNFNPELRGFVDVQYRTITYDFIGPDQNGNQTDQSDQLNFINPKIGLTYDASSQLSFNLFSGIAQKEPNRNDYVESSPQSRPDAEWLWDTELSMRASTYEKLTTNANFYYMKYRDQLALTGQINDVGAATRINVDDSYRMGLELEMQWKVLPTWEIVGNFTWSKNEIKSFTQFVDSYDANFNYIGQEEIQLRNTPLSFSPESIGFIQLAWQAVQNEGTDLSLYIRGKHVDDQYVDLSGDEANQLDAYQSVDAGLNVNIRNIIGKNVSIGFDVLNIFDEAYANNGWSYKYFLDGEVTYLRGFYPQALRHYTLRMAVDF